jgi:hypothetical protein
MNMPLFIKDVYRQMDEGLVDDPEDYCCQNGVNWDDIIDDEEDNH